MGFFAYRCNLGQWICHRGTERILGLKRVHVHPRGDGKYAEHIDNTGDGGTTCDMMRMEVADYKGVYWSIGQGWYVFTNTPTLLLTSAHNTKLSSLKACKSVHHS